MKTISINTGNKAESQLLGADFDSGTLFNGRLYFATTSGLKKQGGTRDDELDVKAWVTIYPSSIGFIEKATIRTISIFGRIGGQLRISVDGNGYKDTYLSDARSSASGVRIGINKKLKDWVNRIRIENYDGSSVNMSRAELAIIPGVSRRS